MKAKMTLCVIMTFISYTNLFANCFEATEAQNGYIGEYVRTYKNVAINQMNIFGIPASIILAQGIYESSYGRSTLAKNANNHFGMKCKNTWTGETISTDDDHKNECFRKYSSAIDSYKDYAKYLKSQKRYSHLFLLDINDYKGWAKGLKSSGYATNPTYDCYIIEIIERYGLQELSKYAQPATATLPTVFLPTQNTIHANNNIEVMNNTNLNPPTPIVVVVPINHNKTTNTILNNTIEVEKKEEPTYTQIIHYTNAPKSSNTIYSNTSNDSNYAQNEIYRYIYIPEHPENPKIVNSEAINIK